MKVNILLVVSHHSSSSPYQSTPPQHSVPLPIQRIHLHISTQSILLFPVPVLCIYSTKIFLLILDTSIPPYQLDQLILAHLWHFHFYVFTWQTYSCASSITSKKFLPASLAPPFPNISNTFLHILDNSTSMNLLDQNTSISTNLLDQNILEDPWHLYFYDF